jgi:hypothetical protein
MNTLATFSVKYIKDILIDNQLGHIAMENKEEVISRLKFISHIQKDEKINVRHVNRQPNNFLTKIYRTMIYPDNRSNALKFIRDVIIRTFEIIETLVVKNDIVSCKVIFSDLLKAKTGMYNLKYTYSDDTKFCCDMDVLIEFVCSKILLFKENHPEMFEEKEKEKE